MLMNVKYLRQRHCGELVMGPIATKEELKARGYRKLDLTNIDREAYQNFVLNMRVHLAGCDEYFDGENDQNADTCAIGIAKYDRELAELFLEAADAERNLRSYIDHKIIKIDGPVLSFRK